MQGNLKILIPLTRGSQKYLEGFLNKLIWFLLLVSAVKRQTWILCSHYPIRPRHFKKRVYNTINNLSKVRQTLLFTKYQYSPFYTQRLCGHQTSYSRR